jgi:ribonuclease HI
MVHLDFKATNNMIEYEALLFGLSTSLSLGVRQLLMQGDFQLIIKQVMGECCYNDPQLAAYLLHARKLENDFKVLDLQHIPCAENTPRLWFLMDCLKGNYDNLPLGWPT